MEIEYKENPAKDQRTQIPDIYHGWDSTNKKEAISILETASSMTFKS